ncbi:hypothetical protein J31TS6_40120 [Brevibacillus reuszeri]|uniref:hypothetical protein n=1 Tax=Brevibacillus reuszeri TaxID=54915 RepID=UPI001B2F4788|nr:hypothetical protein [Brevibacillus reuszeri]GIO07984.1 hypothetical protein J31TS6_40120 [Brevibacillus reuszeri]
MGKVINNLATPGEMVADILSDPVLQSRISADAFIGLLMMANMLENEKTTCCEQVG